MNWKGGKRSQINRESNTHVAAESQTILYWANIVLITNIYAHYRITWKKIFRRCVKGSVLMINRTLSGRKQIVNRLTTHTQLPLCALSLPFSYAFVPNTRIERFGWTKQSSKQFSQMEMMFRHSRTQIKTRQEARAATLQRNQQLEEND